MRRNAPDHPKMVNLAAALKVEIYAANGLMERIWHFTAKYAPQGNIGKMSDEAIAQAAAWRRPDISQRLARGSAWKKADAAAFVQVLVDCGWLDTSEEHRLVVHDWHEHADQFVKKNLQRSGLSFVSVNVQTIADSDQSLTSQRSVTDQSETGLSPPCRGKVRKGKAIYTIREENTNRAREDEVEFGTNPLTGEQYEHWTDERCNAFLKSIKWKPSNITNDQTKQILAIDPFCFDRCNEGPGTLPFIHSCLDQFELHFYKNVWRDVDKKAAREAWMKATADDTTGEIRCAILAGAEAQRPAMMAREEQFRPHLATWIRHGRWNDQAEAANAD